MRRALVVIVSLSALSCADRAEPRSEVAVATAEHLCAVQSGCGCEAELLIPDCEKQVVQTVTRWERAAIDAGLEYQPQCLEAWVEKLDGLASCESWPEEAAPTCPVYSAGRVVDEACELYSIFPLMTHCQAGLKCLRGACRDVLHPEILELGDRCSEEQSSSPIGFLGVCGEGLRCDSRESLTCIVAPPRIPAGGECIGEDPCEEGAYCRTPSPEVDPSEDDPGLCTPAATPDGAPCQYFFECATSQCVEGTCYVPPPAICSLLDDWEDLVDAPVPLSDG